MQSPAVDKYGVVYYRHCASLQKIKKGHFFIKINPKSLFIYINNLSVSLSDRNVCILRSSLCQQLALHRNQGAFAYWHTPDWQQRWKSYCISIFIIKQMVTRNKRFCSWSRKVPVMLYLEKKTPTVTITRDITGNKGCPINTKKNIKGLLHPQNKNVVINHLPPCRSKPVKALFVFGRKCKIF